MLRIEPAASGEEFTVCIERVDESSESIGERRGAGPMLHEHSKEVTLRYDLRGVKGKYNC